MNERSSDQIRRDIERTRADMDETVDALENKLSPGELLDELWSRVKSGGGDLGSVVGDSVRDHPLPLALMGAGLAWLAVERATQSRGDQLRGRPGEVEEKASRTASRVGRGIERGFFSALDDHPLALGAVTFGLGIAAGVSVPTTRAEDELMGRTSQTLKDEAARLGHETGEQVKHVARDAARTARDEADRQGLRGDLGHKVEQVAKSARDAARDSAREEGLSGDRLKERGREAVEGTRETANEEARRRSS